MTPQNIVQAAWFPTAIVVAALLDLGLKMYTGWYAARRKQLWWFIALMLVNSIGILPIIYLLMNPVSKSSSKK